MRFLIFLAIIGTALAAPKNGQRIVGGAPTTIDRHPYMSNMQYRLSGIIWSQGCGGSLITASHVVSAAHCYEGDHPSDWQVVLGTSMASSGGTRHMVSNIVMHPEYSSVTMDADVAVITLAVDAVMGPNVRTIAIVGPNYNQPDGTPLTAIGWGIISTDASTTEQLLSVEINQFNQEICAERYAYLKTQPYWQHWPDITPGMLCTGISDKDFCTGDSGGPVVRHGGSSGDILVGIISWNFNCGHPFYPAVLARVSHYSDWLRLTTM